MNKKLRALFDARNLWQYLMITGDSDKSNYEPAQEWMFECSMCEYVRMVENIEPGYDRKTQAAECAEVCPLSGFAWRHHSMGGCFP